MDCDRVLFLDTIESARIGAIGNTAEMFVIEEGFSGMQIAGGSTSSMAETGHAPSGVLKLLAVFTRQDVDAPQQFVPNNASRINRSPTPTTPSSLRSAGQSVVQSNCPSRSNMSATVTEKSPLTSPGQGQGSQLPSS